MQRNNQLKDRISLLIRKENTIAVLCESVNFARFHNSNNTKEQHESYLSILELGRKSSVFIDAHELVELLRCKQVYKTCEYANKCDLDRLNCKRMLQKVKGGNKNGKSTSCGC